MIKTLYNILAFDVAWLLCVTGGNQIAIAVTCVMLAVHFYFVAESSREVLLIAAIFLLGVVVDALFMRTGLLTPPEYAVGASTWLPPVWLMCLWALYATLLNHSLKWFKSRWFLSLLLGGAAGVLSYYAGTRLSDYGLGEPLGWSLLWIGIAWAIVFPVSLMLAQRFEPPSPQQHLPG